MAAVACQSGASPTHRGHDAPVALAVIVDQLAETHPNPDFVEAATVLLEQHGYRVRYIGTDEANVDAFRGLPTLEPELVLLRIHSARRYEDGTPSDEITLFTGEFIDLDRHRLSDVPPEMATSAAGTWERLRDAGVARPSRLEAADQSHIGPVFYLRGGQRSPHFGVRASFVAERMEGVFPETEILMMGCDGLRSDSMGRAFLQRGAARFVSWDDAVTAPHTDAATLRLLELHIRDGLPLEDAVVRTSDELGPDPRTGAVLRQLPRPGP